MIRRDVHYSPLITGGFRLHKYKYTSYTSITLSLSPANIVAGTALTNIFTQFYLMSCLTYADEVRIIGNFKQIILISSLGGKVKHFYTSSNIRKMSEGRKVSVDEIDQLMDDNCRHFDNNEINL